MMTCRQAREVIVAVVRDVATEAERLRLEEHLAGCEACRVERGHWALIERVRDLPTKRLPPGARSRVLRSLTSMPAAEEARAIRPLFARPAMRTFAFASFAAAAGLALVLGGRALRGRGDESLVTSEKWLREAPAGAVAMPGAKVLYPDRTTARLAPAEREIDLVDGEVDVEVTPGGPGRFRVVAPRFIVEVLGTRFVVRPDGMRTIHGRVRVLDREGHELAVIGAGESWSPPAVVARAPVPAPPAPSVAPASPVVDGGPTASSAPRTAVPAPRTPHATPARVPAAHDEPTPMKTPAATSAPAPAGPTAARLLDEARRALAARDLGLARDRVHAALAASPTDAERATASLYLANALRLEGRKDDAIAAYRETAKGFAAAPSGEAAAFALAQLLVEGGRESDARAACAAYLARYPQGRFHREIEAMSSSLSPPPADPEHAPRK